MRKLLVTLILLATVFTIPFVFAAPAVKGHHVAIHIDANDPAVMNLALNNAQNIVGYYKEKGEEAMVEIVADGPGLNMLRTDTSPTQVLERIRRLSETDLPAIKFSACANTRRAMEKAEGKPIPIILGATVVPSGVVRLTELQEQGWSYLKP